MGSANSSKGFFDHRREWSKWKHEILRRYLPKFAGHLQKRFPVIYYVDGFAGAGRYDESPPVDGSPLIAARIAENMATFKKQYDLRCINVEPEAELFAVLCEALASFSSPRVRNLFGTFEENLDGILTDTARLPTLFFLDPFGYKGTGWQVMERLAIRADTAKTELIVNLNLPKIDRDASWIRSNYPAARAFVQTVTQWMGTDQWIPIILQGLPTDTRYARLKDFYLERLKGLFDGLGSSYPVRTVEGHLKYYVLYVTTHPCGLREMSDVIYRVDHDYEEAREQARRAREAESDQGNFFEVVDATKPDTDSSVATIAQLAEAIYSVGVRQHSVTFESLQDLLVDQWFGQATEAHFRHACKLLIRNQKIDRQSETGIKDDTPLVFRASS